MYALRRLFRAVFRFIVRVIALVLLLVVAAAVISRVTGAKRERYRPEQIAPKAGRYVSAGDVNMFVQEAGASKGTPILLVHGPGAWSEIWRETMTALARAGFHAIAIDVPPFGYSEKVKPSTPSAYSPEKQAKRIVAALDSLRVGKVILVGHSVAARPTVETALSIPGRVERLVLVDPALGFGAEGSTEFQRTDPSLAVKAFFRVRNARDALLSVVATNPLTTRMFFTKFVSNPDAITDARVEMLQQPLIVENTTPAQGDWLQYVMESQDKSQVSDFKNFAKLTMPVLMIWGSADTVAPLWQGRQLQKLIPNADLAVLENVGHVPYIESVQKFNETLVGYLQQQRGLHRGIEIVRTLLPAGEHRREIAPAVQRDHQQMARNEGEEAEHRGKVVDSDG